MPQYQQQKKGQSRVRILSKDATRAYLLLMQKTGEASLEYETVNQAQALWTMPRSESRA